MGMVIGFSRVTQQELDKMYLHPKWMKEFLEEYEDNDERSRDPDGFIEKAWGGIQFLLDAADVPIELLMDGDPIDDQCLFCGWSAEAVKKTAEILGATPFETLAVHFDPARLSEEEVYPMRHLWDADELEYLRDNYATLANFFNATAAKGDAALMEFNI